MAHAPRCPVPHQKVRSHQLSVAAMAKQMHRSMAAVRNRRRRVEESGGQVA
jgi:hypothetical protein